MCGIVGYKGNSNGAAIALRCIKNLEYRGYDSIGMASKENSIIEIRKGKGAIDAVNTKYNFSTMKGNEVIAHTRWATTGAVTDANSHPHTSNDNEVTVVHNGIIENYQELKKELKSQGVTFNSETDSEVIPHLISHYLHKKYSIEESIVKTLHRIEGSYALLILFKSDPRLFFARKDSPLVIGKKENEEIKDSTKKISTFFAASDITAFLEDTKTVMYIENNEYGWIDKNVIIKNLESGKEKKREYVSISWSIEEAKKGNYPHFMVKEMYEQPSTIIKAIEQDPALFKTITELIKNGSGIFFVGCGTSYHAAVSSSYQFAHIAKRHVNVVLASEFTQYSEFLTPKTVMIALSQSGETADVLDAVKMAKEKGVTIISIVNVMGSSLVRTSDYTIMMNAGPEICVLSTKSYTSQLALLLYLAYDVANQTETGKKIIKQVATDIPQILAHSNIICKNIAQTIYQKQNLFLIGRDLAYPSALEGALKIKEVSYIHAEGFAGGELKHGTIALIEEGTPTIVLSTPHTHQSIISNALEIKARGGYIIGIGNKNNECFDAFIEIPDHDTANPISMIVPLQLLAYHLALLRGCDPDKPRNLAKSVTVR